LDDERVGWADGSPGSAVLSRWPVSGPQEDRGTVSPAAPLRLFLIEDDPADAVLAEAMLAKAGVVAEWSRAGRLADVDFDAMARWADCTLVDLGLPDSRGLEVVRTVLDRVPQLPVVVFSGNGDEDMALRAVREGAQDYVVKGRHDAYLLARTIRYAIERKLTEQELQQAQQLAKLGRLAGGIAHHFNNLLGVVLNYANFVEDALAAAPDGETGRWRDAIDDLRQIQQAAQRAAELTRQLGIFAEQDPVTPQLTPLNEVIAGVRERLAARIGSGIALDMTLDPAVPAVLADRAHVEELLAVLADNARDAMGGTGRLAVSTAEVAENELDSDVPVRVWAQVQVRDAGQGISGDVMGKVFDPFFTTKPPGQGNGLGLAVAHAIVTRWGGRIDLRSVPGLGTTVTILFPAAGAVPGRPVNCRGSRAT